MKNILDYNPKTHIIIKGAYLHNLKHVDLAIPRNKMSVITGLSGSGKSSLAFDTLYAEGQRRYVESLSSYARQFMGRLNKPKVDFIKGLSPAIAVEQKVSSSNPRSTVGTKTEIYDYLKLLFARIGKTYSPISGQQVKKDSVRDVIDKIKSLESGDRFLLLAPIEAEAHRTLEEKIKIFIQQGFARIYYQGETLNLDQLEVTPKKGFDLVIDRLVVRHEEDFYNRVSDAIEMAFYEGKGDCALLDLKREVREEFSNSFELDGMQFSTPSVHLFSFNNPLGACPVCEGFGDVIGIDPELVIPDTSKSIYDHAIVPWRGSTMTKFYNKLINNAYLFDFPIHKPYFELTKDQQEILWKGNSYFTGIHDFFKRIEKKNYKIQNRVLLSRYRGKTSCTQCGGTRLKEEASFIKIEGKNIGDLLQISLDALADFFQKLKLNAHDRQIAERLLIEINSRLKFVQEVGLGYLTLNRRSNSLSGGESQRIQLATSLGSSLVGSMYILDEPSIGLHSRDNRRLIEVLKNLRDLGNTVIVVEHDEEIMNAADQVIDIGPEAGTLGGEIVAQGTLKQILKSKGLTAAYLNGSKKIEVPKKRRTSKKKIEVVGAREQNLKNINIQIPLGVLTVVSGVSGSGKSSLVKKILYPALLRHFDIYSEKPGAYSELKGDLDTLRSVEFVDQNPIGRSSRSNPVTYIKAYDEMRSLYASLKISKNRNYQPRHFSFNVDGGRCDHCKGEGIVTIEMQFMADVILECEHCNGKRFKKEILEVKYQDRNIDDLLSMTVDDAIEFFSTHDQKRIIQKLQPLQDVGLGYVTLGQSSATLSGGEAQRIKLASFISQGTSKEKVLFIFDEPSTGLHFHDIQKLLTSFNALIDRGHTIVVVEHNLELIKCADHLIDLGPEAGDEGGYLVGQGTPEEIIKLPKSHTGKYLKDKLK
ncbi:excinuclease ABC subunit UvrA [Flavobacteriaceae bacterium]|jgi:excinuclease ABC subunit A|nr:excinuclease ABC subunit UvrA [Flavobacteriaceae bacterium]MDC0872738.1 excinuclease ABC subunit UvrA [Flavobacteriaceae bacterium]